jgi:hypothetical protein
MAYVVVMACRDTADIALSGALLMPERLQNLSLYRSANKNITLDAELQEESDNSGLAFQEQDA